MNKYITIVVVFIIIVVGGYFVMSNNTPVPKTEESSITDDPIQTTSPSPKTSASTTPDSSTAPKPSTTITKAPPISIKTFTVTGQNYSLSPSEIKVKKGDTVKIVFKNNSGTHDWVIDEFNARTSRIQTGQTAEVEFVADKTGTFEYYCSVGSHRQQGMVGKLIVE